ncbi:hypothetical protein N476_04700 [Pseudoalteromonas luteoviolacea H33]|uniref:Gamma-glutamylcyclotransferase AIG2-like domain-containing protein n=1 Tax=Pseudoalteromonas luteoviolacea H33 TaxID=1365251 RepID=A0A167AF60_9GAMM|nr:gamma-glutamylcyclotransferase family protein [Pseudoalteromonas luteoviolacea]KZN45317.1 hypothetical protein N476_04700 [Pseudoalteromonas luteoviolacea H33]KZN70819.1 hypothetical protein N477_05340 [Pseudoalteromonas luteoviolacea H33-S]
MEVNVKQSINKLFVYGSLAPDRENASVLEPLKATYQKGWVKGKLYEQGWGAAMGYPGIELSTEGDWIEGYLVRSSKLNDFWQVIDEFEGQEYTRQECEVKTASGECHRAYIYTLIS